MLLWRFLATLGVPLALAGALVLAAVAPAVAAMPADGTTYQDDDDDDDDDGETGDDAEGTASGVPETGQASGATPSARSSSR
jgi:hypothetical protein